MTITQKFFPLLILGLFFLPFSMQAQNGIIGTGFANGWSNPGDVLAFSGSLGNSRILTVTPNGTGDQYFRLVKFWNNNNSEFGPFGCTDTDWSNQSGNNYDNMPICGGGAFYINCPNTSDNYVFKTADPDGDDFVYFRVEGSIVSATNVSQPVGSQAEADPYEVAVTISDIPSNGQFFYVRYSTDDFASSTIVSVAPTPGLTEASAPPVTWSATIPGQPAGTTVKYYVFSAGAVAPSPANADWFSINANTNGGANYQYDVLAPAPVTLSHFNAQARSANIQLNWSTASEENANYFDIEKSRDGAAWNKIGRVAAAGNSSSRQDYIFTDTRPEKGVQYYRLQQLDNDGSFEYSAMRSVQFDQAGGIFIYPNPVADHRLFITSPDQSWDKLIIRSSNGQDLGIHQYNNEGIDISSLPPGLYFLLLEKNNVLVKSEKLIVR